jgi:hypothetical protein
MRGNPFPEMCVHWLDLHGNAASRLREHEQERVRMASPRRWSLARVQLVNPEPNTRITSANHPDSRYRRVNKQKLVLARKNSEATTRLAL